ncbi:acyltransferase [Thalassomonas sp. M1454]|uniref:acyltransferase n=1 Tax=Thalassomonas sp. M1454 TaxID=2594477 RepID=UPI0028C38418|nr:acyltransferase [Thalassomonas sp. M1454]
MISFGVLFSQTDTEIFDGVYIGPQSNIGSCAIEENCLLGSGVHILSGKRQHNYSNPDVPLKDQGGEYIKVTIGANTWIGNGAIVMANVGKNCVIAAGSVVTEDVADNSIMAGNPAVLIKPTHA